MKKYADLAMLEADQYARKVMNQAKQFVCYSDKDNAASEDVFEQKRIQLIIQFIFPQLEDWKKGLLACLYWQHELFEKLCNMIPPQDLSQTIMFERYVNTIEKNYMDLINKILAKIPMDQLSPIQQVVIEEKFIKIQFQNCK